MRDSIIAINSKGAGGYSTKDNAHDALATAVQWDQKREQISINLAGARPSFCSSATYLATLDALKRSDITISEEAWRALIPHRCQDGISPWGWANSNGPGYAMLIAQLGAGYSYQDWTHAQPYDIIKMWWTTAIGGSESGHIAVYITHDAQSVTFWSSNTGVGYSFKSIPRSSIKRVLFTRICDPRAFRNAGTISPNPWLTNLLRKNVSWKDCQQQLGH